MIRWAVLAAALPPVAASAGDKPVAWREVATPDDRRRLRGWRDAWLQALPAARAGDGARAVAAEGALFDPDRSLRDPVPPVADYRCRAFKLGAGDGHGFVAHPPARCRVVEAGAVRALVWLDGLHRPVGSMYPDTVGRAVFLGSLVIGPERRAMRYGRDRQRDMAGLVERVGDRRWRLVLPYPRFGSLLDVVEIVPGSVGTTGGGTTAGVGATASAGSAGSAAR